MNPSEPDVRRRPGHPKLEKEAVYNYAAIWQDNRLKIISLRDIMKRLISQDAFKFMADVITFEASLEKRVREMGGKDERPTKEDLNYVQRLTSDLDRAFDVDSLSASLDALLTLHQRACGFDPERTNLYQFAMAFSSFRQLLENDLSSILLLTVPPETAAFYRSTSYFGEEAQAAFPSAQSDMVDACTCYALGLNTACVFHVMRVLEVGLQALAKDVGVAWTPDPWGQNLKNIEEAVQALHRTHPKKAFYSDCCTEFKYIKDAWRNVIMHLSYSYDEKDAKRILEHSRNLLKTIAKKLAE
jgi:hypothetical protein